MEDMRVNEIGILGDHRPLLSVCRVVDPLVGRPVPVRQVQRMLSVASCRDQPRRHPPRQLRVHEEVHGATG